MGIWNPHIQRTWLQTVVLLDNIRNICSGFLSESDSEFLLKLRLKQKLNLEIESSDNDASFTHSLHNNDRNNNEFHKVLDQGNHEQNLIQTFSPVGTSGPINCIPSISIPHKCIQMLLGDEFIHLLVEETDC